MSKTKAYWLPAAVLSSLGWWACKGEATAAFSSTQLPDAGAVPPDAAPVVDGAPAATDAAVLDATPDAVQTNPHLDALTAESLVAALTQRAKKQAAGMKPLGEVTGTNLTEGGELVLDPFTINPQQCVTVLAQGGPGVTEVDVRLSGQSMVQGAQGALLAVDNTTGPEAALIPCYKNVLMLAIPAVVTVKATHGAGGVAARIYVK